MQKITMKIADLIFNVTLKKQEMTMKIAKLNTKTLNIHENTQLEGIGGFCWGLGWGQRVCVGSGGVGLRFGSPYTKHYWTSQY